MKRLGIAAKIWMSIWIFIAGYFASIVLGQIQGFQTEARLRSTAEALFPAAQRSQEAEAAFQRATKSFRDAVMIEDEAALETGGTEMAAVVNALRGLASVEGIDVQHTQAASGLAVELDMLRSESVPVYGQMMKAGGNLTDRLLKQSRELAARNEQVAKRLTGLRAGLSKQLREDLNAEALNSSRQRTVRLVVFLLTLVAAGAVVNLTIRRSITGPVFHIVQGVLHAADEAAAASTQMARSGLVVASGANEQASYLAETSTSLEDIAQHTRQNAERAATADQLMRNARSVVEKASKAMEQLNSSMNEISTASHQVAGVLKTIDEIAFHTNILALNAAVEAARAGESGAGFSVVADEVRALAARSAEAARNSASLIQETLLKVDSGVKLVKAAHGSIGEIATSVGNGSTLVSEIAANNERQSYGISQVNGMMSRMGQVTQGNAANAQESATAASAMSEQVERTREFINELAELVGSRT
ncbi:MAG TPA: methyl-accepting chemotaxis protein [Bryobacteraceae bacterium]|nr:methyl-accepting chemotaxis protein [Bryobacteraceae bacterium]